MAMESHDVEDCIELLNEQPCFVNLNEDEFRELSQLFIKADFRAGDTIVSQGDLVNSIFLIAEGTAEVATSKKTSDYKIIARLERGDSIGLADSGFFSMTGARNATVTAVNDVQTYEIDLKFFHEFFQKKRNLGENVIFSTDVLLRMEFIKKISPFARISPAQLFKLASNTEEITYLAGQTIFNVNEVSDAAYFITSGEVEISIANENGADQIFILKERDIFGEAGVVLKALRSATAKAKTDCKLLKFNGEILYHILHEERINSLAIMRLMRSRSRPSHAPNVEVNVQEDSLGGRFFLFKQLDTGNFFQVSEEGMFIWEQIDGVKPISEITKKFSERYKGLTATTAANLIMDLSDNGFISLTGFKSGLEKVEERKSLGFKLLGMLRKVMEYTYGFKNVDSFLTKTYPAVRWIFSPLVQAFLILIILSGSVYFFIGASKAIIRIHTLPLHLIVDSLGIIYILFFITVFMHEAAHAYATKHYGRNVYSAGIGWYWVGPIAFCDTTDVLLCGRNQRLVVNAAGLYINLLLAGAAAIASFYLADPLFSLLFWIFALSNYLTVLNNLNPINELDGYYLLVDLLKEPDLREKSITWLTSEFSTTLFDRLKWKIYRYEIFYWIVVMGFLFIVIPTIWWVQVHILGVIFPSLKNWYISLLIPLFVLMLSLLTVWSEAREN